MAMSFAISDEDEMTLGPFIIVGTGVLPVFRIWLEIFLVIPGSILFVFNVAWTAYT